MATIKGKYNYDCDVLIVGGGPAGSGLAYHLAMAGVSVIVAESEKFPRDKVCGDGVSPIALAELHNMGITQTDQFATANEINQVGLFIKNDKVLIDLSKPDHLPLHARIIPRKELDFWIFQKAQNAGAKYLEETRFSSYSILEEGVSVNLKTKQRCISLFAKVIVGADGSSSAVARQLQGRKPEEQFQLLGLRAYYEGVNGPNNRVDIFFAEESFPGIYWMFPKGAKGANIGMAMIAATLPQKPAHIKQLLQQHIAGNKDIASRIGNGNMDGKIVGWPITFFNTSNRISDQRILLVGDAAGLINPLSGDGIQYALLSARWASEVLIPSIEEDLFSEQTLYQYRKKVDAALAYDFAFSNFLVSFARNKTLSPIWMEIIATLIARAKTDKQYADTIAGIFEGTYPSYKALTTSFVFKSILQAGTTGLGEIVKLAAQPSSAINKGKSTFQAAGHMLDDVHLHADEHVKWLAAVLGKGVAVAGHTLSHFLKFNK